MSDDLSEGLHGLADGLRANSIGSFTYRWSMWLFSWTSTN